MVLAVSLAYLLVYVCLSSSGGYTSRLYVSGRFRYQGGLGMPDMVVWQPVMLKAGFDEPEGIAWLFAPLISIDHRIWHRPVYIDDWSSPAADGK
jgi:hypothetical protein